MKEIFVGSSGNSIWCMKAICELLNVQTGVKAIPWTASFPTGFILFEQIENLARKVSGAVLIASPDDPSKVKGKTVRVPRANVMLEFGYFAALLGRPRVALCRFENATLPSDLGGMICIEMGKCPNIPPSRP